MKDLQLSRVQQCWLMLALISVCLPLWFYLPFWVGLISAVGLAWRSHMLWRGSAQPSLKMTALIGVVAIAADLVQYRPPIGLEPMSALLVIGCCLKMLEMRRIREARMVLYLCYFIAAIQLIFEQAIWNFCVALIGFLMTLTAQNVSQRDPWQQFSLRAFSFFPLRSIARLAMVSLPMALFIFVFAPRMPSFWVIPVQQSQAQTGISGTMSPGSIAELTRSDKLAFRVGFQGSIPPQSQMYWRAIVLSDFDGQRWSNHEELMGTQDGARTYWTGRGSRRDWQSEIAYEGEPLIYDIYQEPSSQHWLFAIAAPTISDTGVGMTKGLRLVHKFPVTQRIKYRVTSYPEYRMSDALLDTNSRQRNLRIPGRLNPRTRELAQTWIDQGLSADQIVRQLYLTFNREFTYTLEPGTYGVNSIDDFLFDRKRGFCEHLAQATVFSLRAAGVPARIVGGYQGGEINQDYVLVHQYDAHAWTEYWQDGKGWVHFDPTAAVAPERIELGARELLDGSPEFLADAFMSLSKMQNIQIFNWMRLKMDSLNYLWVSWVLGYDNQKKLDFFQGLFGNFSYQTLLIFGAGLLTLMIAGTQLWAFISSPERKRPEVERQFDHFRLKLEALGMTVKPSHTPGRLAAMAARIENHEPDVRERIALLCELFEEHLYREINRTERIREALRSWNR